MADLSLHTHLGQLNVSSEVFKQSYQKPENILGFRILFVFLFISYQMMEFSTALVQRVSKPPPV